MEVVPGDMPGEFVMEGAPSPAAVVLAAFAPWLGAEHLDGATPASCVAAAADVAATVVAFPAAAAFASDAAVVAAVTVAVCDTVVDY